MTAKTRFGVQCSEGHRCCRTTRDDLGPRDGKERGNGQQCVLDHDCADDPKKLATFWEQVLDYKRTYESDEEEYEVVISPKDGKGNDILFGRVPDEKKVKNRIHLDLNPTDQDAEVERVLALGATRADIGQGETSEK